MVGIEALLGAGQRLDPRLVQKARPEVGVKREWTGVKLVVLGKTQF